MDTQPNDNWTSPENQERRYAQFAFPAAPDCDLAKRIFILDIGKNHLNTTEEQVVIGRG